MIGFWVATALLAAGAAALMLHGAAASARLPASPDPQVEVYRRAVLEIDDLAERDLLAPDERSQLRAEAARRLISAAKNDVPEFRGGRGSAPLAATFAVALLSLAIYMAIGSPGLPDQPFAGRVALWRAHPEDASPAALAATLESIADQRPDDPTPLRKLALMDLGLGDIDGAAHALRRALVLRPADADLAAMLGEVKVLQGGGSISPDARALFQHALRLDPNQAASRYYLAKAEIVDGDTAGGLSHWRELLATLPANDPRHASLAGEIDATERTGKLAQPTSVEPPPSTTTMDGAIRGMVDGLASRLVTRPDDPQGWVRLVRAYSVLGDTAARDKALAAARMRFAGRPDELAALEDAANASPMNGVGR